MEKTSIKKKHKFYLRIILPTFLTIGLFITSLFLIFIPQFENAIMDRKREMIKELTNSAWSIMDKWYNAELKGEVTRDEAQAIAKTQIESLRYGEELKDYFWITDFHPKMIMHPYRRDLNNKDLTDFKDSNGKILFVEMVNTARANGGGFVDYMWQWKDDPTRIVPKLSYVKKFENWQWVIGTGIYIEDVSIEIAALEKQIINISIGITIIISFLLLFITYQNIKTEKQRLQAEADLHESREKFKSIVEASSEGLVMILENKQIYFNKTICQMLGYLEDEIKTLRFADIFVKQPTLSVYNFYTEELKVNTDFQSEQMESALKKKDGTVINSLLIASPISFLNNSGVVFSFKDITAAKHLSGELYKTEEAHIVLTNKLSIGVFQTRADEKLLVLESNGAMKRLLGIKEEDGDASVFLSDFFEKQTDCQLFYNDVLQSGFIKNRLVRFIKKDGKKIFVSVSAVFREDLENNALFIDGILEDYTEQINIQKERDLLISDLQNSMSLLNRPIEEFIKSVPRCSLNTSALDAIKIMAREKSETVLLTMDSDKEIGIVTLTDLKNRLLVNEADLKLPAHKFMSSPLISINHLSSIYDALVCLSEKNVHHLLVKNEESQIIGIINSGELQKAFHLTYLFFIRKIQNAESIIEIKSSHTQAMHIVDGLIKESRSSDEITRMTTVIADAVLKRLIQLTIKEIGEPQVSFAFITLGSEGREEQTLSTDQDNAIVFDECGVENFDSVQAYFLKLGQKVSDGLDTVGYKYCKGKVMAKNPQWCQPLSVWKNYFTEWITKAEPKDLLDLKIFFDLRFIYGNNVLIDDLQKHINHITSSSSSFFIYMAESILQTHIPEGAYKLKTVFDIKSLMLPVVDLARLYSLKHQISTSNTSKRLALIFEKNIISHFGYINLLQTYNLLMQLRFKHQALQIEEHKIPDNFIDPHKQSDIDLMIIKKSVSIIEDFQNKVRLDFKGTLAR
jgi:PAS domain S-box-containing protein